MNIIIFKYDITFGAFGEYSHTVIESIEQKSEDFRDDLIKRLKMFDCDGYFEKIGETDLEFDIDTTYSDFSWKILAEDVAKDYIYKASKIYL